MKLLLDLPFLTTTIAHLSDLHCGDPHFVPDLMERAIAEINELKPDIVVCSGDLTTFGFKEEFVQAKHYLDRDRVRRARRRARQPRLAQRRLRALRAADRRAQLGCPQGRASPSSRSTRPSPTSTTGRSGAAGTAGSRSSSPPSPSELSVFVLHHHLLPIPGTGRERNVVYDAGDAIECLQRAGVASRPLRAQARALRLEAREPVRRQHRHRLHSAASRKHETLLQRRRGRGLARRRLAALSVPRAGADHPVRPRDRRVREVHRAASSVR